MSLFLFISFFFVLFYFFSLLTFYISSLNVPYIMFIHTPHIFLPITKKIIFFSNFFFFTNNFFFLFSFYFYHSNTQLTKKNHLHSIHKKKKNFWHYTTRIHQHNPFRNPFSKSIFKKMLKTKSLNYQTYIPIYENKNS